MHGNGSHPPENQNTAALRELAARLLAPPYRSDVPSAEAEKPELFVGRLPAGMPVEIPNPEEANIVGGAVHRPPRGGTFYEVVLDTPLSAERFRQVYRRQLLDAGWNEADDYPPRSGFAPHGQPLLFRLARRLPRLRRRLRLDRNEIPPIFRLGARDPKLLVAASDRKAAPTDVRLRLVMKQRDFWAHHDIAWKIVPTLFPPRDARGLPEMGHANILHPPVGARRMSGGDSDREPDGSYSHAMLQTNADLASLSAHYADQLQEAGWTKTDEGGSGPQTWSAWITRDEKDRPWTGTFTALALSGPPNRYLLQIHAGRTPAE